MTTQKSSRAATGSPTRSRGTRPARTKAEPENQPEPAPATPAPLTHAPLTPEALQRLRARLARKYH